MVVTVSESVCEGAGAPLAAVAAKRGCDTKHDHDPEHERPRDSAHALVRLGRRTLRQQARALVQLSCALDATFARAARLLARCRGHVVVVGLGKSGHVGRKLAATLASLATPAFFVHATEAFHGDLGQVTRRDVVLLLSNSGETGEILRLLAPLRRRAARLMAITARRDSRLAGAVDVALVTGAVREACPHNLAPTVSTTATLALGDALALAAARLRRQSAADYGALHPGGALGRNFRRVADVMRTGAKLPLVAQGASVAQALAAMTDTPGRPGAACVVRADGRLVGLLTDGDVRRWLQRGQVDATVAVSTVMHPTPHCVTGQISVAEAAAVLRARGIDQLPVVDADGRAVGLVDVQDVLASG